MDGSYLLQEVFHRICMHNEYEGDGEKEPAFEMVRPSGIGFLLDRRFAE